MTPPTLISFKNGTATLESVSPFFQKYSDGHCTLLVRGELFSVAGHSFAGPRDPAALSTLFNHLKSGLSWELLNGNCSCILITPDSISAFRTSFSPHLLFYSDEGISDTLLSLAGKHFRFSFDYLEKFVLDSPSLQFTSPLTPLEGVHRLQPQSQLFMRSHVAPQVHLLSFTPFTLVEKDQSFEESGILLRETLREILQWHLKKEGPVATELSGGLDSSFVTSFLADLSDRPLNSHMYSYKKNPSHAYSEHCAKVVAQEKKVLLKVVDSADIQSPDLQDLAPYQNEPVDFFWQGVLFGTICQNLVPSGSLLFTGFGCDQLFMRNNSILTCLFHRQGFFKTLPLVKEVARSLDRPAANFIFQYLVSSLPSQTLVKILDQTRNWRINPFKIDELLPQVMRTERIDWLIPRENLNPSLWLLELYEEGENLETRFFDKLLPHSNLNYLVAPNYVLQPYLETKGIEYIHPLCDSRMIELAFRKIPFQHIHDFSGAYKSLLREAQKGITPEEVRTRKRNEFSFDGFYYALLDKNRDFLSGILEESLEEFQDWVRPQELRQSLQKMLFGGYSNSEVKLSRLISYLIWRKHFMSYYQTERNALP